jgi:hypothetical protein
MSLFTQLTEKSVISTGISMANNTPFIQFETHDNEVIRIGFENTEAIDYLIDCLQETRSQSNLNDMQKIKKECNQMAKTERVLEYKIVTTQWLDIETPEIEDILDKLRENGEAEIISVSMIDKEY